MPLKKKRAGAKRSRLQKITTNCNSENKTLELLQSRSYFTWISNWPTVNSPLARDRPGVESTSPRIKLGHGLES